MASVTQRIKQVKQPRGGYIKPKEFDKVLINDNIELNEKENIHSSLIGLVVDYMTRYINGTSLEDSFRISLRGANIIGELDFAESLINNINGLDDKSIANACKLVGYDVCFRAGAAWYKPVQDINPDIDTIENIRCMIERSLEYIKNYGPIVEDGFTFEGGYTELITSGDGDFLTEDTLWDFKVSIKAPTSAHTLQLLIYYLMGMHSIRKSKFENIKKLGIFNPRLNIVYTLEINKIPDDIIKEVSENIIGY